MLAPAVAYGYWPCASEQNDLVLFDPVTGAEAARFNLPRQMQSGSPHLCISDFFRPRGAAPVGDEAGFIPESAWAAGAACTPIVGSAARPAPTTASASPLLRSFTLFLRFRDAPGTRVARVTRLTLSRTSDNGKGG